MAGLFLPTLALLVCKALTNFQLFCLNYIILTHKFVHFQKLLVSKITNVRSFHYVYSRYIVFLYTKIKKITLINFISKLLICFCGMVLSRNVLFFVSITWNSSESVVFVFCVLSKMKIVVVSWFDTVKIMKPYGVGRGKKWNSLCVASSGAICFIFSGPILANA